ncbi:MAG: NfeD family protein [Castellaniella sp.]|uniref:NfeD family protein n=1 Tax=Castellaniella sp. TaxID=1955812 RepID=UPI002A36D1B6|nr:NfeD family protein [Castellaniella sp.]MDY0308945.1 NfeD family protein [Castellaniella sp.]
MLLVYFGSQSAWVLALLGLILLLAAVIAIRAHRGRIRGGNEELPGMIGEITQASDARGRARALVRGEIWQVRADTPLRLGQTVRVRAEQGLMLEVEPVPERDLSLGERS